MSVISVIVPIYNTGQYLRGCLDSILSQTYSALDIILLDDGSSDNSYEIMCEYARKDSRVRAIKCEHQGVAAVRKKGVELAEGDFIGFVDSDDWIEPSMYSRLYEVMLKNECDLVSSEVFVHNGNGNDWVDYDNYRQGLYTNLSRDIYPTMLHDFSVNIKGMRCYLVLKLFRSSLLKQIIKDIDIRVFYSEDAMILYRYCLKCKSVYIMREAFYHYNRYLGSAETKPNENEPINMYLLYKNLKEAFEVSPYADVLLPQLYQYVILLNMRVLRGIYGINLDQVNHWEFHDCKKIYEKRIVVYGAGKCGRAFCKELWKNGHINDVVAWVDKKPEDVPEWEKRYINEFRHTPIIKAQPVSVLKNIDFDYIIITIYSESIVEEVVKELQEVWNVPREKIVIAKSCKGSLSEILLSAYM